MQKIRLCLHLVSFIVKNEQFLRLCSIVERINMKNPITNENFAHVDPQNPTRLNTIVNFAHLGPIHFNCQLQWEKCSAMA